MLSPEKGVWVWMKGGRGTFQTEGQSEQRPDGKRNDIAGGHRQEVCYFWRIKVEVRSG